MKRTIIFALLLLAMVPMMAQRPFDEVFSNRTLRVDYYRIGNQQRDSVKLVAYRDNMSCWPGSLTQMLDPFDNGQYRVVMKDNEGKEIYRLCYNTIFNEYCSTPAGKDSVVWYEEVLKLPMPKVPVTIVMQERGKDKLFHTQTQWTFEPYKTKLQQPTSGPMRIGMAPQQPQVVTLQERGDVHKKIDIVIIPEGYGPEDSTKMMKDFNRFTEALFIHSPFKERRNDFNVWGVKVFGRQSGITDPNRNVHVQSAVGASYNTFGADRYLMTFKMFQLHDCLVNVPCDYIIIMANSNTYGGGAIYNCYAVSSLSNKAEVVLTHELGHSIGGLADEYVDPNLSYGDMHSLIEEPIEPNITTLVDFANKWASMVNSDTPIPTPDPSASNRTENVDRSTIIPITTLDSANLLLGAYEGAGYHAKGIYRPLPHCMMRDYAPFCPVCSKRLEAIFDRYIK